MNISFVGKRALVTGAGRGTREDSLLMSMSYCIMRDLRRGVSGLFRSPAMSYRTVNNRSPGRCEYCY